MVATAYSSGPPRRGRSKGGLAAAGCKSIGRGGKYANKSVLNLHLKVGFPLSCARNYAQLWRQILFESHSGVHALSGLLRAAQSAPVCEASWNRTSRDPWYGHY